MKKNERRDSMKVFIGGYSSCSVCAEGAVLNDIYTRDGYEKTSDIKQADLIYFIDSCASTYDNIANTLSLIQYAKEIKKKDAKLIVSGCIANGFKRNLGNKVEEILSDVELIKKEDIISYAIKEVFKEDEDMFPYYLDNKYRLVYVPVMGCVNNCSFCKTNYLNFDVKSVDLDLLIATRDHILNKVDYIHHLTLTGSNLTMYGIDTDKKQRTHELINEMSKTKSVSYMCVGAIINFYDELIDKIIENKKIKEVHISLETGSKRLYQLMNRPVPLDEWRTVVSKIRKERPDILIVTEIIAGFPTETKEDIMDTINLIKELKLYPAHVHSYVDSKGIPSSSLPQYTSEEKRRRKKYYESEFKELKKSILEEIRTEAKIIEKDEKNKKYLILYPDGVMEKKEFSFFDKEYEINDFIDLKKEKQKVLKRNLTV